MLTARRAGLASISAFAMQVIHVLGGPRIGALPPQRLLQPQRLSHSPCRLQRPRIPRLCLLPQLRLWMVELRSLQPLH